MVAVTCKNRHDATAGRWCNDLLSASNFLAHGETAQRALTSQRCLTAMTDGRQPIGCKQVRGNADPEHSDLHPLDDLEECFRE